MIQLSSDYSHLYIRPQFSGRVHDWHAEGGPRFHPWHIQLVFQMKDDVKVHSLVRESCHQSVNNINVDGLMV